MLSILVSLLILAVIAYVAYLILNMIPLPEPLKTIVLIIFSLIILVRLLDVTGVYHLTL